MGDSALCGAAGVTSADRLMQQQIENLLKDSPITTGLVAARLDDP
jgi:hypothetical protein